MKQLLKILTSICTVLFLTVQMILFTSCNDDLAADSYYTFTGEMMSDYLKNREDFSLFKRIVERAGEMDFLSSRGSRTFYPAINSGVEAFLKERGYASVEDMPVELCDTLVKACLIENRVLYTHELAATVQENNGLDLPLIFVTNGDTVDVNGMTLTVINSGAAIINELKNDSVDNGVVHPVDKVIMPNTSLGSQLLDENHEQFTIFYEALRRTGLLDSLIHYRDDSYEVLKEQYPEFKSGIHSGDFDYHAKRPDHRYSGYTLLIVPDKVLYEKYGERFNPSMTIDEKVYALYDLAVEKYDGNEAASIFGLEKVVPGNKEGKTYKDLYWNRNRLESRYNPLNMLLSYHILDRLIPSTAKLINCWGVHTAYADPTEWLSTLLEFSTIKFEKVYSTVDKQAEYPGGFYVNHTAATHYNSGERVRGAHLTVPENNFSLNVAYYFLDDVVAYDEVMRNNVMNTRIRVDFFTLWPELTNNNMRLCCEPNEGYNANEDNTTTGGRGGSFNYYLPKGYLKKVSYTENTLFFVQRPKLGFWNFGGDEINIMGTSYDVVFPIPYVPPGTYEVRLGYPGMGDRGIAQVYVDNVPQGIPMDMRYRADDSRVGGLYNGFSIRNSEESSNGIYTSVQLQENERTMKNNGYYSGSKSIFTGNDGKDSPRYSPSSCTMMYNNPVTFRRKICNITIKPNTNHTIRIRSVFTHANRGVFVLDYMELVPISICGAGGIGEDLY